jgi:N-methylhydantoinase B
MSPKTAGRQEVQFQVFWNRLLAIVEEQAQTLMRTAFSSTVREAGDLSAGVFDVQGRMLAQAITGTPGHVNTLAESLRHFLKRFPVSTMQPGDQFITNDPWLASGHPHDLTVAAPVFKNGKAVAFFSCCCHQVDIGGLGQGADGRSIFEEGLQIPPMQLARGGNLNADLIDIVLQNVRTPAEIKGDILSYVTANEVAGRQLIEMMRELKIDDISHLANTILQRSQRAVEAAIEDLPKGTWRHAITIDGYDEQLTLRAALTIGEKEIVVDFEGSSPASPLGINVVANYCLAYTAYALKCVVAPEVPNNTGSLQPFKVLAPPGSILNAQRPWPVSARHLV